MKHLLLVYSSQTGRTAAMMAAVRAGAEAAGEAIELRLRLALEAGIDDLLWADGLLIGSPENFGYLSGAVKDFLDRTYYPAEGKVDGLPYALVVAAGNDGTGVVRALERIAAGFRWKRIAEPLIARGETTAEQFEACRELGLAMATGLAAGLF